MSENSDWHNGQNAVPTVAVLLSTYNGELYIRELIESVLAQVDVNVLLCVRDDGSSDATVDIIRSFEDDRIRLTIGSENLKPAKSFLRLLRDSENADYYAYCDQDDVWNNDKLKNAASQIAAMVSQEEPALYMSTYDVVDSTLTKMFTYDMHFERPLRLQETLVYRAPSGCTMVFNRALKEVVAASDPSHVRMHDFWTLMVAEAFHFRIITDDSPQLKYRQHGKNAVSITPTAAIRMKRLLSSALYNRNERWLQAKAFHAAFSADMPFDTRFALEKVVRYRDSVTRRVKLMFDRDFHTDSMYVNWLFKLSVLLGLF